MRAWLLTATLLLLVLASAPVLAQGRPLDAPRAAGTVGERYDGLAVLRAPNAPADLRALVDQANAERAALYQQHAATERTTADAVGRIYAQEIMKAAPAGTWFLQESGQWTKK
ncbi:MAG: YdbL family protein [Proteobacteria bacterium]|nr:YdbL family protein [Pseudomonadota bacterium]